MRIVLAAIGRLKGGPEADLTADYLTRATQAGRALALGPAALVELDGRGERIREAEALLRAAPDGAIRVLMDERGEALASRAFARRLADWRDQGRPAACFWIGGADGAAPALKEAADVTLSLGPATWPHRLARAMLAEQIYRAVSILAGAPYHRD